MGYGQTIFSPEHILVEPCNRAIPNRDFYFLTNPWNRLFKAIQEILEMPASVKIEGIEVSLNCRDNENKVLAKIILK